MSTDPTMTTELDMTTHAERIEMWCDLLTTAPYAVQDDVPLDDLRAWIDGIRESSRALEASIARLRTAFLQAERRVESWDANQDQTTAIWLARWGLEPDDLPGVRIGADARGDLDKGGAA